MLHSYVYIQHHEPFYKWTFLLHIIPLEEGPSESQDATEVVPPWLPLWSALQNNLYVFKIEY